MSVEILTKMSNIYGSNPDYVLAGGGNTSFKDETSLYIKASGTTLATITADGFVRMERDKLSKMWTNNYSKDMAKREKEVLEDLMDARAFEDKHKRPSVETLLHNLFPKKLVLHVHPPMINGITCSQMGKDIVSQLFGDVAAWVPDTKPGYILALDTKEQMDNFESIYGKYPNVVFLENHGIFFAADTIEEIDSLVIEIFEKVKSKIIEEPDFSNVSYDRAKAVRIAPAIRMLALEDGNGSIVTFITNKSVMSFAASPEAFEAISLSYTPDHIVYCKYKPLFVRSSSDIDTQYEMLINSFENYKKESGHNPKIIFIEELGFFACGKSKKEADIAAEVFLDEIKIAVYVKSFGGVKFPSDETVYFIRNWEAESYRQSVSIGAGSTKRILDKIAVVTGAAQGFGKGIAFEMAKQGANVVIADLNIDGASATAGEIIDSYGTGKAIASKVDVSDENSVCNMIEDTVLAYGGIDAFINNAGVVKAGSLEEMDVKSFDFVTKINYNGYFLGTKFASRIMKIQNKFNKNYFTDVIQINSKSGLSGSNKNFAYAGSKFGGIGLTQSFALELVEYNIKVNSICPGNFFDGPLWSDPERGLFVQYLAAGKIAGAMTVEDVKRAYESKVPMNRGCNEIDVARAIFYCMEQLYETGQAIPVTGGQEMLK